MRTEEQIKKSKAYYQANITSRRAYISIYDAKNRDKRLEYWKKRNANPEIQKRRKPYAKISTLSPVQAAAKRAKSLKYSQAHSVELRAYWKKYRKDNPEKTKAHNKANWHKRRALLAKVSVNLKGIKAWMKSVLKKNQFQCYYCEKKCSISIINFDHILPLSAGGPHSIENLCTSCAPCNLEKHYKPIPEWMKVGQQILSF